MVWLATILLPMAIDSLGVGTGNEAQLLFAGDAMMHQAQLDASLRRDGSYDFKPYFSAIADEVRAADYAVVNLEVPLATPPYSGYPCFNAPATYAGTLDETGFDLLLTANNHTLDRRTAGLCHTIATLDSLGIAHIGTYRSAEERTRLIPTIHDIAGFKVGFLNYTYGTNGFVEQKPAIVDRIERDRMRSDIEATRRAGAEIIAVCIHWGEEYVLLPNEEQRKTAEWLHRQGVEIVMGAHPHVIQPMELTTDATGHRMLTVYSLGNLISNMKTTDTRGGALVRVELRRDANGRAYVADAAYRLVVVEPGQPGRPFRALPVDADSLMRATTRAYRDAFVKNARAVFNRYNKNVGEDTLRLQARRRRRSTNRLIPLQPYLPSVDQILRLNAATTTSPEARRSHSYSTLKSTIFNF